MKINIKTVTRGCRPSQASGKSSTAQRLKIRSILVPIDFSAPSIKALEYAALFAKQFGAKLTLLHVVEPTGTPDFMAAFPIVMENDELVRASEEHLRTVAGKCGIERGLVEKNLVRTGVPYHEIANAARTLKTDLIIIATHRNTGLKHFLLGSTTERVVRHASCPVFVVREGEREVIEGI
jgi:nucleotide-binding universal stress UspA family protein